MDVVQNATIRWHLITNGSVVFESYTIPFVYLLFLELKLNC